MLPTVLRPAVILICSVALWPFHVESCPALCSHVVGFQFCLALWSPRLGNRELVYVLLCATVCLLCMSFFSCPWCQWLAATCACGTPWTFLLMLLSRKAYIKKK